jgi:hypothetical protein
MVRYLGDKLRANPGTWDFLDFEAHADIRKLPENDIYGISGHAVVADDGTDNMVFTIAVSTFGDENLFRMRKAVAQLYEDWKNSGFTIPLFDGETTDKLGSLVVTSGTVVSPVGKAEIRPYQTITVHMKTALDQVDS